MNFLRWSSQSIHSDLEDMLEHNLARAEKNSEAVLNKPAETSGPGCFVASVGKTSY